jgi:hypothetical protein
MIERNIEICQKFAETNQLSFRMKYEHGLFPRWVVSFPREELHPVGHDNRAPFFWAASTSLAEALGLVVSCITAHTVGVAGAD